tara:strand:- start:4648 stop:5619 length:972 start_codon:yes stop_codon:yes gene_type:complete
LSETSSLSEIARNIISIENESLVSLRKSIDQSFDKVADLIHKSSGKVVLTGVGKSGIVAMKIVATLCSTGTPSIYLHAADATHGDIGMIEKNDVVIGISKSGNSREIKDLIPYLKMNGNVLIGMTANSTSFLAKQSDYLLFTPVEKEACPNGLAPTVSTTVQMVMGDALAIALMELNGFKSEDFAKLHPSGTLGKKLHLKVADLLDDSRIPKVSIDASLRDVIYEISDKRLGATIVEENGLVCGLVTDGDIRRVLQINENISGFKASDAMTKNPICVEENMLANDAMKLMQNNKINHLIVLDKRQTYIGIVHVLEFIKEGLNG